MQAAMKEASYSFNRISPRWLRNLCIELLIHLSVAYPQQALGCSKYMTLD